MYRATTAPSGARAAAANVLLRLPAGISVCGTCAHGQVPVPGSGATACVRRGYPGALLARDPLAEGEAGVLVMMAGAWDASENAQGRLHNASVLDAQSTRRRTCSVRREWLDGVESAAHTPIHWWRAERVEVGGSMRADVRVGVRGAGVCETGRTCEWWIRRRQAISAEVTADISHFLCWVYAPCSSAPPPGPDASQSVSAWTARGCSKGEGADDLGACGGSYESPLPTRPLAADVEGVYVCAKVHAVCGWAVHFRPSFLRLLSTRRPSITYFSLCAGTFLEAG
ncbi:hypothetical protein B0H13DRAFT_1868443 [Mycena leptocephala]|nr:hypothetical protein B0H13DRAFT_1868443 [Mycena leptocephala]